MPVNPHRMFVADRHGTSHAYRRQAYDSDDSSSDDSDQEEFLQFPEDQKRSLNNVALEVARITRKINRLEQYGIPVRANDQAFLSLEESLSVSRWMLQEQIETKMFAYTFSLMVLIPLFICFPIFISTSAEYWVSGIVVVLRIGSVGIVVVVVFAAYTCVHGFFGWYFDWIRV
jgi:hypothetical protein